MTGWAVAPDPMLKKAQERMARIEAEAKSIIRVLTAEQALKAQHVVWEAGRRK